MKLASLRHLAARKESWMAQSEPSIGIRNSCFTHIGTRGHHYLLDPSCFFARVNLKDNLSGKSCLTSFLNEHWEKVTISSANSRFITANSTIEGFSSCFANVEQLAVPQECDGFITRDERGAISAKLWLPFPNNDELYRRAKALDIRIRSWTLLLANLLLTGWPPTLESADKVTAHM